MSSKALEVLQRKLRDGVGEGIWQGNFTIPRKIGCHCITLIYSEVPCKEQNQIEQNKCKQKIQFEKIFGQDNIHGHSHTAFLIYWIPHTQNILYS